jgi:Stress-induced bacterial acidophilic repeat motif
VVRGGTYCALHSDPKKAAELGRKGGRANRHTCEAPSQEVVPPESVGDVKRMLAQTMANVLAGKIDPKLGTTVAYMGIALLRAYEAGSLCPTREAQHLHSAAVPHRSNEKELGYEILDINTGLPISADTTDNGARSAARVHRDEELRGVTTKAAMAPTTEAEVVRHKKVEDFEILDLP